MSALDNARAALTRLAQTAESADDVRTLRVLIAEHERVLADMHERELHHFEAEQAITTALKLDDAHLARNYMADDVRNVLEAALMDETQRAVITDEVRVDLAMAVRRGFHGLTDGGYDDEDLAIADAVLAAGYRRVTLHTDRSQEER